MEELIKIKEKPGYTVLEKKINEQYLIERCKLPFLKVFYNVQTKKGKLHSFFSGSMRDSTGHARSITKHDIEIAVKETIAWARDNIVAE